MFSRDTDIALQIRSIHSSGRLTQRSLVRRLHQHADRSEHRRTELTTLLPAPPV